MTHHNEDSARLEFIRRVIVLTTVVLALVAGLIVFYARQSLVIGFDPRMAARVWLPTVLSDVHEVSNTGEAQGIPVLVYHGIVANAGSCNVTPETFQAHMSALNRAGYRTLSLAEFEGFMTQGARLPERSVLITFDDGRTDSFAGADPVLRALGFRATMFSILGNARSSKPFYLTQLETRMMAQNGRWDVQSHTTNTHVMTPVNSLGGTGRSLASRQWRVEDARLESDEEYIARVTADLTEARDGLADLTGRRVTAFAYPWGDYGKDSTDPLIRTRLREITGDIYPMTFTQASPTLDEAYNHPFDFGSILRRIYISHDMSADDLMARLDRGKPKTLPFEDADLSSTGWATTAGSLGGSRGRRVLAAAPDSPTGRAEVFLDGSRSWEDYTMIAEFSLEGSETVSLIARRAGPRDYLAATVSRSYVSIEQVVGDQRRTVGEADAELAADGTSHDVTLRLEGRNLTLRIDGTDFIELDDIDPSLMRGGVGLRIDPALGRSARLRLNRFEVVSQADMLALSAGPDSSGQVAEARRSSEKEVAE